MGGSESVMMADSFMRISPNTQKDKLSSLFHDRIVILGNTEERQRSQTDERQRSQTEKPRSRTPICLPESGAGKAIYLQGHLAARRTLLWAKSKPVQSSERYRPTMAIAGFRPSEPRASRISSLSARGSNVLSARRIHIRCSRKQCMGAKSS